MKRSCRYTVVTDGAMNRFRVFDNASQKFMQETFRQKIMAQHAADGLNEQDALEMTASAPSPTPTAILRHPMAAPEGQHVDKRQQIVLAALVGKVVCSGCGKEYHGFKTHSTSDIPKHSIKVTRYVNFDGANLTVDITCTDCGHGGLYKFDGNPLQDEDLAVRLEGK